MIRIFQGIKPAIPDSCFIEETAVVIGDVVMGEDCSAWFHAVIRGDVNSIRIGHRTNVQDLCMLHVTHDTHPLVIGDDVTIGHNVVLHGCTIQNRVLVGMGAIIMDGAIIGEDSVVGAGALITEGKVDLLVFFWDPFEPMPHDPDVKALLRVAVTYNIPIACDRATADFLLTSPLMHEEYEAILPDYSIYTKRKIK